MQGLVLGVPSVLPAPPPAQWSGLSMLWSGVDGTVWDLTSGRNGVQLSNGGVRGLAMPQAQQWATKSPAVHGQRYRGHVLDEREVFWPLHVFQKLGGQDWLDHDRAFWRSVSYDVPGTWTVVQPSGVSRSLACRLVDDGQHSFDLMPTRQGWVTYGVTLVADDPYWKGETVRREFTAAEDDPPEFYGPNGNDAPTFYLTSGNTLANARINNPGDVEAYPVHTLYGPFESATVGVGDAVVDVPIELAEGEWLRIDTAPWDQRAIDHTGANRTGELGGSTEFAPVPAGRNVPLAITIAGTGRVRVEVTPRYHRAW